MADIVYLLRNGIEGDELKYSLRSLKNFPHDKVWFFGGKPAGVQADHMVELNQKGVSVWEKTAWTVQEVCRVADVSEDFWLFNDDFFIMEKLDGLPPLYDSTLWKKIEQRRANGRSDLYCREMKWTRLMLMEKGYRTFNYDVHAPMLFNKRKLLEVFKVFPRGSLFRSLYGNYYKVGGMDYRDCKISSPDKKPKALPMLSTSDESFMGLTGDYIKSKFKRRCRFEIRETPEKL